MYIKLIKKTIGFEKSSRVLNTRAIIHWNYQIVKSYFCCTPAYGWGEFPTSGEWPWPSSGSELFWGLEHVEQRCMCFLRTMIVTITMVRTVNNMAAVTLPAIAMVSVFFSPKFSEVLRAGIDGMKSGSLCTPGQHIL